VLKLGMTIKAFSYQFVTIIIDILKLFRSMELATQLTEHEQLMRSIHNKMKLFCLILLAFIMHLNAENISRLFVHIGNSRKFL